jgi:MFS transporter, ACS family, tartrate transporter
MHQTLAPRTIAERTRRRVDRRLMPFIFLLYIVSYLDRVNVSSAALQMTKELGFSDSVFGFGSGIFFVGYFLLEVPGGILAELWSARKWLARILISWGAVASLTGLIHTAGQFYAIRFILGVAEAGFVPGVLVYLSHWYCAEDRGKAIALFFAGIPASQVLGGPLAAVLLRIHWLGLGGWRWLLILEGLPALTLGIVTLFYLTERPQDAEWLSPEQRDWLVGELEKEQAAKPARAPDGPAHALEWTPAVRALADVRVLLLSGVLFLALNATYGVSVWLPKMVQRLSTLDVSRVSLIAAIPSLCSLPVMLLVAWHSDKTGERIWHAAIPRLLAGAALAACFFTTSWGQMGASVVMLSIATIGFYSAHGGFWPLPNVFLGRAAAAASLGLINSFGNLGGFLGPYLLGIFSDRTGSFGPGLLYLSACSLASGLLLLWAGRAILLPAKLARNRTT